MPKKEMKFEEALSRLEKIVQKLESEETELSDALKLFEEGTELSRFCSEKLDEVKRKIEIITKKSDKIAVEPFKEKDENCDA